MSTELMYLTWVTVLTAIMWIPYILNMIMVRGLMDAVGYPEDPAPLSPWAQKMKAAHANAVENLVVFAALVLIADAAGVSNATTVLASSRVFLGEANPFRVVYLRHPVGQDAHVRHRICVPGGDRAAAALAGLQGLCEPFEFVPALDTLFEQRLVLG